MHGKTLDVAKIVDLKSPALLDILSSGPLFEQNTSEQVISLPVAEQVSFTNEEIIWDM